MHRGADRAGRRLASRQLPRLSGAVPGHHRDGPRGAVGRVGSPRHGPLSVDALRDLRLEGRRWIEAAHALEDLPSIAEAFASGELGLDKVVTLTRFGLAADLRPPRGW